MTAKHTPGPWYVVSMRGWGGLCIGRRPQDEADKTAGDAPIAKVIEKAPHWQDTFPAEANARLIAAAPDLLVALEALIPMFAEWHAEFPEHVGDKEPPALQAALAAIATARGISTPVEG